VTLTVGTECFRNPLWFLAPSTASASARTDSPQATARPSPTSAASELVIGVRTRFVHLTGVPEAVMTVAALKSGSHGQEAERRDPTRRVLVALVGTRQDRLRRDWGPPSPSRSHLSSSMTWAR
jgi:hypothetical protein